MIATNKITIIIIITNDDYCSMITMIQLTQCYYGSLLSVVIVVIDYCNSSGNSNSNSNSNSSSSSSSDSNSSSNSSTVVVI